MDFVGIDSDDGAVFFMHTLDFEGILSIDYDIVVEFVPEEFVSCDQKRGILACWLTKKSTQRASGLENERWD